MQASQWLSQLKTVVTKDAIITIVTVKESQALPLLHLHLHGKSDIQAMGKQAREAVSITTNPRAWSKTIYYRLL